MGLAWVVIPILAGCGGGDEESAAPQPAQHSQPQGTTASSTDQRSGDQSPAENGEDGNTQWIGDIPYDVYYDRPLTIATSTQTVAAATNTTPDLTSVTPAPTPENVDPMPMPMTSSAGSGEVDWASMISIEVLDEEVKQIRNRLGANLQTVATFNREQEPNKLDAVVLSALASIAISHPGELNWKEKAPHIRDLANTIFNNCTTTGREAFGVCEVAFEQIETMLDGGPVPADLEADPARPPYEVADRFDLMYRFRQTSSHLKSNINSEARLKEDVSGVVRELSVLSALAALISMDGYGYAEEADYQTHLSNFISATQASRTGAELESFEQFSQGIANIQKSCNECHQQYAFGTEAGI